MSGNPVDPYLAKLARERLGHIRTTADLIAHIEDELAEHRLQGTLAPARVSVLLACVIDHLWRVPNVPQPRVTAESDDVEAVAG